MDEKLVDSQSFSESLEHLDRRLPHGVENILHQFGLSVIGQTGDLFAHQLACYVKPSGNAAHDEDPLALRFTGSPDGIPIYPTLSELV